MLGAAAGVKIVVFLARAGKNFTNAQQSVAAAGAAVIVEAANARLEHCLHS